MGALRIRHLLLVGVLLSTSSAKCGGPPLITPNTAGLQHIPVRTLRGTPKSAALDVGTTRGALWLIANNDSLRVVYAFNNPCQNPIVAGFRRRSDVIDIGFFDPTPRTDPSKPPFEGLVCPAAINIVTYEAIVPGVPAGHYMVNVFGSPDTTYWKPQFAAVHGTVVVP
jgi:hypothetical protein